MKALRLISNGVLSPEFCVWSLFCSVLLSILPSFEIILQRKRELVALLWL